MTDTPVNNASSQQLSLTASRRRSRLLTALPGTPYRTPDVRRFGPPGSSWRTMVRHHTGGTSYSRRTSTPLNRDAGQRPDTSLSQVYQRTELEEENIKVLMSKTWQAFRLTPLYNMKAQKSDLQLYSRTLSSHVAAESKKGVFVDIMEPGDAVVGLFSGLDTGIDDPKALLIDIKGKARNKSEDSVLCQAVLFSTDLHYNPVKAELQDNFTYYSCMLLRGPVTLSETLQNWIEVEFDCRVVKQTFTSHDLSFMAAMFTGYDEEHKPVELVYKVPSEVKGLSDIHYSTDTADCKRLWKQIRSVDSEDNGTFTSEEAKLFITGLESHFYEIFNVKLNAIPVATIETSVAFVGRDGKIKLHAKSTDSVLKVLRHLTDIALDQLKIT